MGELHVYLENGFDHDRVVVSAGGANAEEADATTRYQIGLASTLTLPCADGAVPVTVSVPGRGLSARCTVDPRQTPHLRVNLGPDGLALNPQAAPPMFA